MEKEYLKQKGRIFDIQKYSIHDGPGIRTIVFLKGCALRCKWCCNPESQSFAIQTMRQNGEDRVIGRDVTVEEVMEEVVKDMPHYRRSGGGLTLSGGESLLQPDFASALLRAAQSLGINTALSLLASPPLKPLKIRFCPGWISILWMLNIWTAPSIRCLPGSQMKESWKMPERLHRQAKILL